MPRPLKKGVNGLPRQFQANVDEAIVKGIDLEGLGTHKVDRAANNIQFTDPTVGTKSVDQVQSTAKVSSNDTTPGNLSTKLVAGSGITLSELNDGGNETFEIKTSGVGKAPDTWAFVNSSNPYTNTNNESFTIVGYLGFLGSTKRGSPIKIWAGIRVTGGTGTIKIVTEAGAVIVSKTFTNSAFDMVDLGSISNIPTSENNLEVQMKINDNEYKAKLNAVTFEY